jgi:signal transduction histidine kinase
VNNLVLVSVRSIGTLREMYSVVNTGMIKGYNGLEGIRVLHEIGVLIRSGADPGEIFPVVLGKITDTVGCHSASLFIMNDSTGRLDETATVGRKVDLIETIDFDMGQGFSAWVAKQRRSVLIPRIREDRPDGFRSFVSVPLVTGETLIGVMNIGHNEPDSITEEHMNFLEIVAGELADSIERAMYEAELIKKNNELMRAQEEIKKQQQQIIEMEKFRVLGQMAASINHEINNPLTTIMGNVDLLLISFPDIDPFVRKKLSTILSEANRIADITKKIRSFKKIVIGDYIPLLGETIIDIDSSSNGYLMRENLSAMEDLTPPTG